jgi:hypothetical protein
LSSYLSYSLDPWQYYLNGGNDQYCITSNHRIGKMILDEIAKLLKCYHICSDICESDGSCQEMDNVHRAAFIVLRGLEKLVEDHSDISFESENEYLDIFKEVLLQVWNIYMLATCPCDEKCTPRMKMIFNSVDIIGQSVFNDAKAVSGDGKRGRRRRRRQRRAFEKKQTCVK